MGRGVWRCRGRIIEAIVAIPVAPRSLSSFPSLQWASRTVVTADGCGAPLSPTIPPQTFLTVFALPQFALIRKFQELPMVSSETVSLPPSCAARPPQRCAWGSGCGDGSVDSTRQDERERGTSCWMCILCSAWSLSSMSHVEKLLSRACRSYLPTTARWVPRKLSRIRLLQRAV